MKEMNGKKGRFGDFGGQYVPETVMNAVNELDAAYEKYRNDPDFIDELKRYYRDYAGRPSMLYYAEKMSKDLGGAKIYLKREDLNHTGSHKINNVLGQILPAILILAHTIPHFIPHSFSLFSPISPLLTTAVCPIPLPCHFRFPIIFPPFPTFPALPSIPPPISLLFFCHILPHYLCSALLPIPPSMSLLLVCHVPHP